jgi:hypothetical protein
LLRQRDEGKLPLNQEDDLSGHPIGYDLIVLDHALGLFDPKRHYPTQGLRCLRNRGSARIVEADFGLHRDIDIAYDRHICLLFVLIGIPANDRAARWLSMGNLGRSRQDVT